MSIGDAENQAPARLEHARQFVDARFGLREMFDGAHRVDGVERSIGKRQLADVADRRPQSSFAERVLRVADDRLRDVDAVNACAAVRDGMTVRAFNRP